MGLRVVIIRSPVPRATALAQVLRRAGWSCTADGPENPARDSVNTVIVDAEALGESIESACSRATLDWPSVPIMIVGAPSIDAAVKAMRAGAADFLDYASPWEEFAAALERIRLERCIEGWRAKTPTEPDRYPELWGDSAAMRVLRDRIDQSAHSDATAVITGETGAGKELVARLLHASGARSKGPLVIVGCSSIPSALAESELFGHVKGAFSGASYSHRGLIPAAHGGTLFLDDVGALSLDIQAKFLRVLQERAVRPVGSNDEVTTDFRLIVSSAGRLPELVQRRQFREDLYYRLAVLDIPVPPLRERGVDVLAIAERFLETAATRIGKRIVGLTKAAAEVLLRHGWPGNVRELRNALDYAVAVARYDHIGDDDLPESVHPARKAPQAEESPASLWEDAERQHIEVVLRSVRGNRSQAALLLGIDRKTLHRKLDRFGIDIPARFRQRARADESGIIGEPFRLTRAGSA
jgi:two-component system response regulator HydG